VSVVNRRVFLREIDLLKSFVNAAVVGHGDGSDLDGLQMKYDILYPGGVPYGTAILRVLAKSQKGDGFHFREFGLSMTLSSAPIDLSGTVIALCKRCSAFDYLVLGVKRRVAHSLGGRRTSQVEATRQRMEEL
jgi:hypothetical protein